MKLHIRFKCQIKLQSTGLATATGNRQHSLAGVTHQQCSASSHTAEWHHYKAATDFPPSMQHPRGQDWNFQPEMESEQPMYTHQHPPSATAGQPLKVLHASIQNSDQSPLDSCQPQALHSPLNPQVFVTDLKKFTTPQNTQSN